MMRSFSPDLDGIQQCQAFLETFCEDPKPAIITDEIVSNIVRCSGASGFSVEFSKDDTGLITLVFADDGVEFDPTKAPPPDIAAAAEDREIGGLGIFMVKKMAKSVDYERKDGQNVLTVKLQSIM